MIDATPPEVVSADDGIELPDFSNAGDNIDRHFSVPWYGFFDRIDKFLHAFRAAPQQVQQADLAKFLQKLIAAKAQEGVQVWCPSPYNHLMRYTGTGWSFAPGDSGSGYRVTFASPPTADGWHLCDGSVNLTFLKADGSLGTQTLPNTAGLYFRR